MHTAVISLFCGHQALSCLYESYEHISFACCWATACEWANEFSIVYCFSVKPFLTRQRNYTWGIILLVGSSMLSLPFSSVSLPSFPSLLPQSVHPSTHLAEVRSGRPRERRAEWSEGWSDSWSPVRQGETNYPSNESHSSSLHLSLHSSLSSSTPLRAARCTWKALRSATQLHTWQCFSFSCYSSAEKSISTCS